MALPTREIDNWIRDEFGWVDGVHYPLEMSEYLENCERKLREIFRILNEEFNNKAVCNDLQFKWERTHFDLTSTPIETDYLTTIQYDIERHTEIQQHGRLLYFREMQRKDDEKVKFQHKLNLTYNVELHWLRRPNHYTDYYSLRFMDMLSQEDIPFTHGDIKWVSDVSNGQMFGERFEVDFSKEISEEYVQELCKEYKRLNG